MFERNRPDDTFGWGVVLSDETLANLEANDPVSAAAIRAHFALLGRHRGRHGTARAPSRPVTASAASGARRLLAAAAGTRAGARRQSAVRGGGGRPSGADGEPRSGRRRRRAELARARGVRRRLPARHRASFATSSSGSARIRVSTTPSPSSSSRPSTAGCGRTPTSSSRTPRPSSSNVRSETWRRAGFGAMTPRGVDRGLRAHLRRPSRRPCADVERQPHLRGSAWISFPRVLCERWRHENLVLMGDAAASAHFSIGSGTKLALESAIALADELQEAGELAAAPRRYEDGAPHRGAAAAVRGAQFGRMVRGRRALSRPRSGAVQLFAADALAAHQPREPAPARPAWLAGAERWFQRARRRARRTSRAPMFAPFRLREHGARQPHRGLADGAIPRRRRERRPTGTSSTMPSAPRAAPGSSHRDDLRQRRGPHHAGLPRPLCARARGGLEAHRRFRPRRNAGEDRHAARPFRRQGLDPARLGGDGRAAARAATGR